MADFLYHTVYKITNTLNSKFYVGMHSTNDLNDRYYGSGIAINKAINKYGIENFNRDILFIFDNKEDMIKMEMLLVDELIINQPDCYNLTIGGKGGTLPGWKHTEEALRKIGEASKGRVFSQEHKKRISEANKGKPGTMLGQKSPEHLAKIAKALTGKKLTEEHKENISKAKKNPPQETRIKISESNKNRVDFEEHMQKMRGNRKTIGMAGKRHSQEAKDKMSSSKKGKISPRKGAKLSEETKLKISTNRKKTWAKQKELQKNG